MEERKELKNESNQQPIIWWKDKKLLAGVILILLNFIVGVYAKILVLVDVTNGLIVWAFSWVFLFLGIFLVGRETAKIIQATIHSGVKKTVKGTYEYTKGFPKKSYDYTERLSKKGIEKITTKSKDVLKKIKKPENKELKLEKD